MEGRGHRRCHDGWRETKTGKSGDLGRDYIIAVHQLALAGVMGDDG